MIGDGSARLIGTETGGYRVLSRIGSGSMGHVYEAEQLQGGRHVALKVLHKRHQKEFAPRFLREGKTLALLGHPNIVQLVDMGQLDDGALFLATELVAGDALRDVMDRGAIEPPRALRMIRQLLEALDAAHALGVVHRDIKPENVMIFERDCVKVLDFGVAKLLADTVAGLGEANLTSIGFSIFGSALYIAPEAVTGQPVDARLDLYSTGAMLFEMIAGAPPFNDEDPSVLLRKHAFEAAPTLQQIAPAKTFARELEALVARALAKQPDDRFRSAADMIAAVDAALRTFEPPARAITAPSEPAGVAPPLGASGERRATTVVVRGPSRRTIAIGAGVAAAAIAVVMILIARGGSTSAAGQASRNTSGHEHAIAGTDDAAAQLSRGHSEFALGHHQQAMAAYERALRAQPRLGADKQLRTNALAALGGKDSLAAILALDLLASLSPADHDAIVTYASKGKLMDARHRAMMIAERDGFADKIDQHQSWILDLQQSTSCDERRAAIEQLAGSSDRRALAALKRAKLVKCLEPSASDAIARLQAGSR
jgi:tetratricopeptide (TPR) repeat protein